jgi:Outer membrane lipoprotein-sorting protein
MHPIHAISTILALTAGLAPADETTVFPASADEVVRRVTEMDKARASKLRRYSSERRYIAENRKFSKRAEVVVQESYVAPDRKELNIVSETGSSLVRRRVIDKLIEAELDAVRDENRDQTHINLENYAFKLSGVEQMDGRSCFVLEVAPKIAKKYLMRGRVWIDRSDYAIVRLEGSPAKNPSIWTRDVHFVRRYEKHGPFWLPVSMESESKILVAGKSTLRIEYSNYQIDPGEGTPVTPEPPLFHSIVRPRN